MPTKSFRFFDLPSELRRKILGYLLLQDRVVDLDPANAAIRPILLNLFLTSQRLHNEAYNIFYGGHTFRIFPVTPRFFGSKIKSVLSCLSPRYRATLRSLEIRLGTGWSKPPKTWTVNKKLGLQDCIHVRDLVVFVECDPSHQIFNGFRVSRDFFTGFAGNLLERIVEGMPHLEQVTFDRYGPSVRRDSELMGRLQEAVLKGQKRIAWARGKWRDDEEVDRKRQSKNSAQAPPLMSFLKDFAHLLSQLGKFYDPICSAR